MDRIRRLICDALALNPAAHPASGSSATDSSAAGSSTAHRPSPYENAISKLRTAAHEWECLLNDPEGDAVTTKLLLPLRNIYGDGIAHLDTLVGSDARWTSALLRSGCFDFGVAVLDKVQRGLYVDSRVVISEYDRSDVKIHDAESFKRIEPSIRKGLHVLLTLCVAHNADYVKTRVKKLLRKIGTGRLATRKVQRLFDRVKNSNISEAADVAFDILMRNRVGGDAVASFAEHPINELESEQVSVRKWLPDDSVAECIDLKGLSVCLDSDLATSNGAPFSQRPYAEKYGWREERWEFNEDSRDAIAEHRYNATVLLLWPKSTTCRLCCEIDLGTVAKGVTALAKRGRSVECSDRLKQVMLHITHAGRAKYDDVIELLDASAIAQISYYVCQLVQLVSEGGKRGRKIELFSVLKQLGSRFLSVDDDDDDELTEPTSGFASNHAVRALGTVLDIYCTDISVASDGDRTILNPLTALIESTAPNCLPYLAAFVRGLDVRVKQSAQASRAGITWLLESSSAHIAAKVGLIVAAHHPEIVAIGLRADPTLTDRLMAKACFPDDADESAQTAYYFAVHRAVRNSGVAGGPIYWAVIHGAIHPALKPTVYPGPWADCIAPSCVRNIWVSMLRWLRGELGTESDRRNAEIIARRIASYACMHTRPDPTEDEDVRAFLTDKNARGLVGPRGTVSHEVMSTVVRNRVAALRTVTAPVQQWKFDGIELGSAETTAFIQGPERTRIFGGDGTFSGISQARRMANSMFCFRGHPLRFMHQAKAVIWLKTGLCLQQRGGDEERKYSLAVRAGGRGRNAYINACKTNLVFESDMEKYRLERKELLELEEWLSKVN